MIVYKRAIHLTTGFKRYDVLYQQRFVFATVITFFPSLSPIAIVIRNLIKGNYLVLRRRRAKNRSK